MAPVPPLTDSSRFSPFSPDELRVPLIQAPMAGGVSTPSLAAAVGRAGGLGFLAAGYLSPDALAAQIAEVRESVELFGVNLFVPQPVAEPDRISAYRRELAETEARRYGPALALPEPDLDDTDHWQAKLALLLHDPVPVVSFTFGLPDAETVARFRAQGTYTVGTVTSVDEARQAANLGVDALCVQGPEAGGHRGVFDPAATPSDTPLPTLLAEIRAAVAPLPLIAAGALATPDDVARARAAGAVLTQHGTAFLRADEAGTQPLHRAALTDPRFAETVLTRAFSGRWVRTLRNRFTDEHPQAPAAYPALNQLTRPLRAAAAKQGDPDGLGMYAGTGHHLAQAGPAAEILATLAKSLGTHG
jgi:nitronate monooxygenase